MNIVYNKVYNIDNYSCFMQELKLKSFHCDNLPHTVCMPHYCIMCLKCNVSLFFPSWSQNTIYIHLCRNWLKTPWMQCVTTSPGLFYSSCKQPVWCGLMIGGWAQLNTLWVWKERRNLISSSERGVSLLWSFRDCAMQMRQLPNPSLPRFTLFSCNSLQ